MKDKNGTLKIYIGIAIIRFLEHYFLDNYTAEIPNRGNQESKL